MLGGKMRAARVGALFLGRHVRREGLVGLSRTYTCGGPPKQLCATSTIDSPTGLKLPLVGLGTWQITDAQMMEQVIRCALSYGYRHFDTATFYENECAMGEVFQKIFCEGTYKREDIIIATKLPFFGMTPEGVKKFLGESLEKLKMACVDLYYIHFPAGCVMDSCGKPKPDPTTDHAAIWKAMECMVKEKKTKYIGLSNFNKCQLEKLVKCVEIKPATLQMELHAYLLQKEIREFAKCQNIPIVAYAPLGSPQLFNWLKSKGVDVAKMSLLEDPTVMEISKKVCKSPAQVLLRFLLQLGDVAVIPSANNSNMLYENIELFGFELSGEDINKLCCLDKGEEGRQFNRKAFASLFPCVEEHPMFPF